jgi:hypothetical protein
LQRNLLSCNVYQNWKSRINEPLPRRKYNYKGNRVLERIADSLKSEEDKKLFLKMLEGCQKYALAIIAKGKPFPTEPLNMALLLEQHKMINWLQGHYCLVVYDKERLIPDQKFHKWWTKRREQQKMMEGP